MDHAATRREADAGNELERIPNWALWRTEADEKGRPRRILYQANGAPADPCDPKTFTSYEEARASVAGHGGLAFCMPDSEGFAAFTVDESGALQPASEPEEEAHHAALEFLEQLRPGGPWVLTAIVPDGKTRTTTATTEGDVRHFVGKYNGTHNCYFTVNPVRRAMTKKPAKTDIAAIEFLLGDLDPRENEASEAAKARYLAAIGKHEPKPPIIIDSGNGLQVLYKLAERIELPEPEIVMDADGKPARDDKGHIKKVFPKETQALIAEVESRSEALMKRLGSVAGTQNIDRILRLPGTINLPNEKKRKAGRTACAARLIRFNGTTCRLEDFPKAEASAGESNNGNDARPEADDKPASETDADNPFTDAFLPRELQDLIENIPPAKDLSEAFHHTVCWLHDLGWSAARIEARIIGKPIVPDRYEGRLRQEINRCLLKAKDKKAEQGARADKDKTEQSKEGAQPYEVFWHGKENDDELVSWLVKDLIFENGTGLASGPWGAAKSFVVLDLAASIATATPFAGREVVRQGGVLFVAAEGANQVRIRLEGVVEEKLRPAGEASGQPIAAVLPFGWIEDCPNLQDDGEFARLVATAKYVAGNIYDQFDLPLALIVIDTLSATGSFKDANDAAEGQRVMNQLAELNRQTGAFVLAVDHFGKAAEAGTRGTTAKEAAADIILALLADREINGKISNTRMALRKLRGGQVGIETPFSLKVVDMGMGQTTCIVEWQADGDLVKAPRKRWPKSLRIFKSTLETALIEHGEPMRPFGYEGPEVRAVPLSEARREFVAAYPADASDPKDAKRKAFTRALKDARERELIGSREIGGIDHLWLVTSETAEPMNTTSGGGSEP